MANLTFLFATCLVISNAICAPANDEKKKVCPVEGLEIPVGEKMSLPGKCTEVTCLKDLSISGITCPLVFASVNCTITEIDYKKPYPECCSQVKCA